MRRWETGVLLFFTRTLSRLASRRCSPEELERVWKRWAAGASLRILAFPRVHRERASGVAGFILILLISQFSFPPPAIAEGSSVWSCDQVSRLVLWESTTLQDSSLLLCVDRYLKIYPFQWYDRKVAGLNPTQASGRTCGSKLQPEKTVLSGMYKYLLCKYRSTHASGMKRKRTPRNGWWHWAMEPAVLFRGIL